MEHDGHVTRWYILYVRFRVIGILDVDILMYIIYYYARRVKSFGTVYNYTNCTRCPSVRSSFRNVDVVISRSVFSYSNIRTNFNVSVRWTNSRVAAKLLEVVRRPNRDCNTNIYLYHTVILFITNIL